MVAIWLGYILLVYLEIIQNYKIIEKKKQRPVYWQRTIIRIVVSLVYWAAFYWIAPYYKWLSMLVMMPFTFWFIFDYGLNLMRGKPLFYLNPNGSWLDRMQTKTSVVAWFFWKFILMTMGVWLAFKGVDVIWLIPN